MQHCLVALIGFLVFIPLLSLASEVKEYNFTPPPIEQSSNDSTGNAPFPSLPTPSATPRRSQSQEQGDLEKQILCAFEKGGVQKEHWERAQYSAKHLSDALLRLDPQWRPMATRHIIAQALAETGNLAALEELPSGYASSRMEHKGRGLIQLTHRDNYAKFAGCVEALKDNPSPQQIPKLEIAEAQPISGSEIVSNPDRAFDENTENGQWLNAMSLVCYMVDTLVRHPELQKNLDCCSDACVREVGVAVNRGPGDLGEGRRPLGDAKRLQAFKNTQGCFPETQSQCAGESQ